MTNEELNKYLEISADLEYMFHVIGMLNPWISLPDKTTFRTSKYIELLNGEATGITSDVDNEKNLLIKTVNGNFISIKKDIFLHMVNNQNREDIESTINKLIKEEYYESISELNELEEKVSELSNIIKNQQKELEALLSKKHQLKNQWQQKNH